MRKCHKVPHYKEIVHKVHFADYFKLRVQPLTRGIIGIGHFLHKPFFGKLFKIFKIIHAVRRCKAGQMPFAKSNGHVALTRNLARIFNGVFISFQRGAHLFFAFKIELIRAHTHAVFIVHVFSRLYAKQKVLRLGISLVHIMDIVRGNGLYVQLPRQICKLWQHLQLFRQAVVLQFNIKIIAKYAFEPERKRMRIIVAAVQQRLRYAARKARRKAYEPFVILFKYIVINPRLIIKPVHKSYGAQFHKVFIADLVLCKQNKVVIFPYALPIVKRGRRNIGLHAEYWFYALLCAFLIEIYHAVHHAVICYGNGIHAQFLRARNKRRYFGRPVKQAVYRMHMQMRKTAHIFSSPVPSIAPLP